MSAVERRGRGSGSGWLLAIGLVVVLALGGTGYVLLGGFDVAADRPHSRLLYTLIDTARERSIAVRSRGIEPPSDLDSPARVSVGAGLYNEMCTGCHLGPGIERSELSQGLYPQAPELAKAARPLDPGGTFWIIKHGVKLSAMPAWGKTHPDPLIWDMVAFLRKLPTLDPVHYKQLVASAPEDHDEMMKTMSGKMHGMDSK